MSNMKASVWSLLLSLAYAASLTLAQTTATTTTTIATTILPETQTINANSSNTTPSEEVDPEEMDLCIESSESAYMVNHAWTERACNQTCRCVFRSERRDPITDIQIIPTTNMRNGSEQTEIRCGMPPKCETILTKFQPTADCPAPKLIFPQLELKECTCPKISCGIRTTTVSPPAGCRSKLSSSRLLSYGETFTEDCQLSCRCYEDSEIRCQPLTCPKEPADLVQVNGSTCLDWQPDPDFQPSPSDNRCCPPFVCRQRLVPSTTSERPVTTTTSTSTTTQATTTTSQAAPTTTATSFSSTSIKSSTSLNGGSRVSPSLVDMNEEIVSPYRGFDCEFGWQKRYAMHLLIGFCTMSFLFLLVSCMYLKKSPRFVAPISSQSAHDNPTFTKLKSYATQSFLVDQNYTNEVIMAKKKNLELNNSNMNIHQINDTHHQDGRQHLI